jgi:hypothetical protein
MRSSRSLRITNHDGAFCWGLCTLWLYIMCTCCTTLATPLTRSLLLSLFWNSGVDLCLGRSWLLALYQPKSLILASGFGSTVVLVSHLVLVCCKITRRTEKSLSLPFAFCITLLYFLGKRAWVGHGPSCITWAGIASRDKDGMERRVLIYTLFFYCHCCYAGCSGELLLSCRKKEET